MAALRAVAATVVKRGGRVALGAPPLGLRAGGLHRAAPAATVAFGNERVTQRASRRPFSGATATSWGGEVRRGSWVSLARGPASPRGETSPARPLPRRLHSSAAVDGAVRGTVGDAALMDPGALARSQPRQPRGSVLATRLIPSAQERARGARSRSDTSETGAGPVVAAEIVGRRRARVGDAPDGSSAPGPRRCYILHGLLGSKANWAGFVRKHLVQGLGLGTDWEFVLVDLRNHGDSDGFVGPHTMRAAADDVIGTFAQHGPPDAIVGHSLGGKVALEVARKVEVPLGRSLDVWVLDAVPGAWDPVHTDTDRDGVTKLLEMVRDIGTPIPSRSWLIETAKECGFSLSVAEWLGSSLKRMNAGQHGVRVPVQGQGSSDGTRRELLTWGFDPQTAEELLFSYTKCDSWDVLEAPRHACAGAERVRTNLVVAERSSRWKVKGIAERLEEVTQRSQAVGSGAGEADGGGPSQTWVHHLDGAGHWLHVDNPVGLAQLLRSTLVAPQPAGAAEPAAAVRASA